MLKFIPVFLLSIICVLQTQAQFNPAVAQKSLVQIIVRENGSKSAGICSGFIWNNTSSIVTSLHAMRPSAKITVVYPGGSPRSAQVSKVYKDADLVLLKTDLETAPLTTQAIPITSFHQGDVSFAEKIYAIGYNGGSAGNQTQSLEKGFANPETLEFLVRPDDLASLKQVGFPSTSFPIYFLSGSLLPGFSGSPVYNQKNELIGIGDGGLERGMMNVSWCIPANNLTRLENSADNNLPPALSKINQLYSAEVSVQLPAENDNTTGNATEAISDEQIKNLSEQADSDYSSYAYGNFNFYQTKTRTWQQMKNTSIDPENMNILENDFKQMNIKGDPDYLNFDIYQDINNGFTVAVPEGGKLSYDNAYDAINVSFDSAASAYGNYFDLFYYMMENNGDPANEVIKQLHESFDKDVHGFTFEDVYTRIKKINDEWSVDYRFFTGDSSFVPDPQIGAVGTIFYLSVIYNKEVAFYSLAVCYIPVEDENIHNGLAQGIDCVSNYKGNENTCAYFEMLLKVLAASHLTTISSLK